MAEGFLKVMPSRQLGQSSNMESEKFKYEDFECGVDIMRMPNGLAVRFYNPKSEPEEVPPNLCIVDPGYGFVFIKRLGNDAILGGFLDEEVFKSDGIVNAVIAFTESLDPSCSDMYVPHHVDRVRRTSYIEYNGEY